MFFVAFAEPMNVHTYLSCSAISVLNFIFKKRIFLRYWEFNFAPGCSFKDDDFFVVFVVVDVVCEDVVCEDVVCKDVVCEDVESIVLAVVVVLVNVVVVAAVVAVVVSFPVFGLSTLPCN